MTTDRQQENPQDELLPALIAWRKGKRGVAFPHPGLDQLGRRSELMRLMSAAALTWYSSALRPRQRRPGRVQQIQNKNATWWPTSNGFSAPGCRCKAGSSSASTAIFHRSSTGRSSSSRQRHRDRDGRPAPGASGTVLFDRLRQQGGWCSGTATRRRHDQHHPGHGMKTLQEGYKRFSAASIPPRGITPGSAPSCANTSRRRSRYLDLQHYLAFPRSLIRLACWAANACNSGICCSGPSAAPRLLSHAVTLAIRLPLPAGVRIACAVSGFEHSPSRHQNE